jgi:hypothetical protein
MSHETIQKYPRKTFSKRGVHSSFSISGSTFHKALPTVVSSNSYLEGATVGVEVFVTQSGHVEEISLPQVHYSFFAIFECPLPVPKP